MAMTMEDEHDEDRYSEDGVGTTVRTDGSEVHVPKRMRRHFRGKLARLKKRRKGAYRTKTVLKR
jgi:hypothetical protein